MAKTNIYEQKDALSAYLDEMLVDPSQPKERLSFPLKADVPQTQTSLKQTILFPSEDIEQKTEEEIPPVKALVSPPAPLIDDVTQAKDNRSENLVQSADLTQTEETAAPPENIPDSQNTVLKILLCDIGGMKVAIEVEALDNIIRWPSEGLSYIPGRQSWEVALLNDKGQNTNIIDIRALLNTPDKSSPFNANYILLADDRRTGIACNSIEQIINKNSSEIRWRQDINQRPWFTGVVSETMHSILNISAIIEALK